MDEFHDELYVSDYNLVFIVNISIADCSNRNLKDFKSQKLLQFFFFDMISDVVSHSGYDV